MIVDDDPFVREVAATALGAVRGVRVMACGTGAAALAAFDGFAPTVLLLDLMLPDMDGRALWRAVSARAPRPRLIFLTGRDDDATRADVAALGAEGLIAKPFDPATFAVVVFGLAKKAEARTARLDALARNFATNLVAVQEAVARHWEALAPWNPAAAEALFAEVHRLAGAAPMFGFKNVGVAADRVEGLLRPAIARGGWGEDAERGVGEAAVREMIAAINTEIKGMR